MSKLRWWSVLLAREASESTTVKVEAVSKSRAAEKALEQAGRYGENLEWDLDDGNMHETYVPDFNSIEEIDPPKAVAECPLPAQVAWDWNENISQRVRDLLQSGKQLSWADYTEFISQHGMNAYEREACVPFLTDEGLIKHTQYVLKNCVGRYRPDRPCSTYDEAAVHLLAPELIRRLSRHRREGETCESKI